jgi:hypothetical protein
MRRSRTEEETPRIHPRVEARFAETPINARLRGPRPSDHPLVGVLGLLGNHSSRSTPLTCLRVSERFEMVETTFLVQFRIPELGTQPVIAARAEVRGEHLLLLSSNGEVAAAFLLENVKTWSEISPEEIAG